MSEETIAELFDRVPDGGTVHLAGVEIHRPAGQANRPVIQTRCVYCGGEHYALAVIAVSHGHAACHNCGRTPGVFTDLDAYRVAVRRAQGR